MTYRTDEDEAVIETRVVHDTHRRATTLLSDVTATGGAPADAVGSLHGLVVPMLRHHHESEDGDLWPTIVEAAPSLAGRLDALSREHDTLDEALSRMAATLTPVTAGEVRGLVHEHLDHEEPILFPALRAHVTTADWDAFSERTVATAPQEGIELMVALFFEVAPAADVEVLLRHLPPEAQAGIPAMRAAGDRILAALAPHESVGAGRAGRHGTG